MRAYRLTAVTGGFRLDLRHEPAPQPEPGQAVVRIRAVSLNYRDLVMRQGQYGGAAANKIPCSDGAGDVVAVGDGVTRVKVGDRVAGIFMQRWISGPPTPDGNRSALGGDLDGMLAEQVALSEHGLVKAPDHLSFEEAATLPCAAVTAWHALVERGKLVAGQTVLVLGTGGVSMFAAQIARAAGARVIATSGAAAKIARLRDLGFTDTVNYNDTPDWDKAVKSMTAGRGVDHVVEVGGNTIEKSLKSAAVGGHIAQIGVVAGRDLGMNPFSIVLKNLTMSGIYVGSREHFERMNSFFTLHRIHPVISGNFGFEEAGAAFAHMEAAKHFGKIVIRI
ncbi:MAG: NAD(P)-dependent alcohol dehydrogenase [Bryobacterales bacterium]|nr:NAD(P)-dependent alcohol dehydrogenase [Bryobacterales bacterium]